MNLVDQPAHNREMAAHDAVKHVPEIARNHCPASAKYALLELISGSSFFFSPACLQCTSPLRRAAQLFNQNPNKARKLHLARANIDFF